MKKLIISVSIMALLAAPVFVFADHAIPHTIEQLQAKIAELQAQINALIRQQNVQSLSLQPSEIGQDQTATALERATKTQIENNIGFGSQGTDVTVLQNALKDAGAYSGPVTGYFGVLTREAVKNFQISRDIPNTGFVGPITRNVLNTTIIPLSQPRVCTREVIQCLDGSYVSRTGANCEFAACPTIPSESSLKVISPNGGEQWQKGTAQNIKWSAPSSISSVSISLEQWFACLYTYPQCAIAQKLYTLAGSVQNNGIFQWIVGKDAAGADIPAGQHMVTVSGGSFSDSSDAPFSIISSSLAITTTSLPGGIVGQSYSAQIAAAGGSGNYSWSISSGALPPGLSLVSGVCIMAPCQAPATIFGVPQTAGDYTFTISLVSGTEKVSRQFTITVFAQNASLPDLAIPGGFSITPSVGGQVGQEILITFLLVNLGSAQASPAVYSYTNQSDGFSKSHSTNTCVGSTILQPGQSCLSAYTFTFSTPGAKKMVVVLDPSNRVVESNEENNIVSAGFEIGSTQSSVTVLSPNGGEQWQKGTVQNITWTPTGRICPPGYNCILADEAVDILLEQYIPPCTSSICPKFAPAIASLLAKQISDDGAFEWSVGKSFEGKEIPDGKYVVMVVKLETNISDSSDAPFSIISSSLAITTTSLPGGIVGQSYSAQIAATGGSGNYSWSVSSGALPPGLSLVSGVCIMAPCQAPVEISGAPTSAGDYTFTVFVTDGTQKTSRSFTITVGKSSYSFFISPSNVILPVGKTTELQAWYQPVIVCPTVLGLACAPLAPYPVQATWTSSNSKVSAVAYKEIPCPAGTNCLVQQFDYFTAVVTGISLGTATITATYKDSAGAVFTASAFVSTVMP